MVDELFTISAINVARAAVRMAERRISIEAPIDIRVGSRDPRGVDRLYIDVATPDGAARTIDVGDAAISACLAQPSHRASLQMVDELVNTLAGKVGAAVREMLR